MRILIIEDERGIALEMEDFLKKSGYFCELAFTAKQAKLLMEDSVFDFILLDLGLPDKDGLTVLEEAKRCCPAASYIIITARGRVEDKIKGLDLGADDYLSKPFSLLELQSRMQAITRRKSGLKDSRIELGDFTLYLDERVAKYGKEEIGLSRKEFDLLSYMALHKNRPLTRLQLSEHIWGNLCDDDYDSNFIDVHIKNIRKKMSGYGETDWLQTIRGVGYKIKL
ncbi:MAG: response regulator transcription factor [Agriterribacter sp.]